VCAERLAARALIERDRLRAGIELVEPNAMREIRAARLQDALRALEQRDRLAVVARASGLRQRGILEGARCARIGCDHPVREHPGAGHHARRVWQSRAPQLARGQRLWRSRSAHDAAFVTPSDPTARNRLSMVSRSMPRVMKTIRERRSSSLQAASFAGGWKMCCTPCTTTGPLSPSTFTRPLTRSRSGPRSEVSTFMQVSNDCQVNGLSNQRQNDWMPV